MSTESGRHALIIEDEMLIALEIEAELRDLGYESVPSRPRRLKPWPKRAGVALT
ncbi:MAG: hypothetical protein ACK41C_02650 [Phenylobacterium sp.]|uniref:hypothetical protein n=1 Tax=Phenylobacterium sp. TaxID=1871053 RepID=UPI00391D5B8A